MRRLTIVLAALALVVAACGDDGATDSTSTSTTTTTSSTTTTSMATTTSSTSSTTSTSTTTTSMATTTTLDPIPPLDGYEELPISSDDFPGSGETSYLVDVRHGSHDGFERVVFEFRSEADLTYALEWVDEAVPPSGDPVEVDGDAILQVTMAPASAVEFVGDAFVETYTGPDRLEPVPAASIVQELVLVEDFEGFLVWAIGTDGETRVAVDVVDDTFRLVIDIEA